MQKKPPQDFSLFRLKNDFHKYIKSGMCAKLNNKTHAGK